MSNIDKQQIRDDIARRKSMPGFGVSPDHSLARLKVIQETQRSFGLEVVEALLDELEAAEKRIAELEAREVTLPPVELVGYGDWPMFDANLVTEALRTAGINVAVAGKGE